MFANNAFCKVWEVKPSDGGKFKTVQLSTSKKKADGSGYETDFSGFARFVGKANELDFPSDAKLQLLSVGVTTSYDKEKKVTYTNYIVFDAKIAENNYPDGGAKSNDAAPKTSTTNEVADGFMNIPDGIDEELPFN